MTAEETPISLTCQCGQTFRVRGRAAGRVVKCPGCSAGVKVPDAEPVAEAFNFVDDAPSFPAVAFTPAINTTPPNLPKDASNASPSPRGASPTLSFRVGRVVRSLIGNTGKPTPESNVVYLPPSQSYPVLRFLSFIVGASGYILVVFSVVFILFAFSVSLEQGDDGSAMQRFFTTDIPTGCRLFITGVLLAVASELSVLAIHVAKSMLATANASRQ